MSYISNIREKGKIGGSRKYRNKMAEGKLDFARLMRNEPTEAERQMLIMLRTLRNKHNMSFVHQGLVAGYIADFICRKVRLIIEVDGDVHIDRREQDELRDNILLKKFGFHTIRFTNNEVLSNIKNVETEIVLAIRYLQVNNLIY